MDVDRQCGQDMNRSPQLMNSDAILPLTLSSDRTVVNTITGEYKIYDSWIYVGMDVESGNRRGKGSWGPDREIDPEASNFVQIEIPTNFDDIPELMKKPFPAATPVTPAPQATAPSK